MTAISRVLLVLAAAVLAVGGIMHARAFQGTVAAVGKSDLAPFYGDSLKALWLADSATLLILAALYLLVAARPAVAGKVVVALTALIPAATAAMLYMFLGKFFAAHMLVGASLLVLVGVAGLPKTGVTR
jgi:hypothetical protein